MTVSTPVRQHIRILDAQGVSWRRMAREVGVSRQTAGKCAELEDRSPKPPEHAKEKSKPDPFKPVIDKWLESDRLMPRKQRHTAMRVWHRLRDEHGYEGSYQLVRRYVRQRKRDWGDPGGGFMEPRWAPGIAQVDSGEGLVCIRGARVKVRCLVVAFPYSNMRWVVALPGENAECVCEGSETVFGHIGLASRVLVFDNATGAAHRVAWDKTTIVDVFRRFVEHCRVEVGFRNPASGWEKGNVENAVGFLRRNLMVPMPNAESYRKLTSWMLSRCDGIAGNTHCRKDVPISDLFAGEKTRMLPLPRVPYDACRWVTRGADREGSVEIDSDRYLAGPSWHGWTLEAGLRAFQVEIRTQDGRFVAKLPRAYGRAARTVRNPAGLPPALARKSRAWGESPIRGDFPDRLRLAVDAMDSKTRQRAFRLLAKAGDAYGFDAAAKAGGHIVEQGHSVDEASLTAMARRVSAGETPDDVPAPDLHAYDRFMSPETRARAA